MTTSGPSRQTSFLDGSPTPPMWPTPDTIWRPHEGNVRLLRRRVEAGLLTEQEADAILGKRVWESQGKLPASISSAAASPASPSPSPANSAGRMIPAISGRPLLDWLPISGPVGCVLRTLAASSSWRSTICSLTWTVSATPRGRWLFRLRASARSTAGIASGLWPTPTMQDGKNNGGPSQWERHSDPLNVAVHRLWPTPSAADPDGSRTLPEGTTATGMRPDGKKAQVGLENAARMWPTPQHRDHVTGEACRLDQPNRHGAFNLNDQIAAATGRPGKLNPDFVVRLMGFPDSWLDLDS